jgi:hypothetical protein
MKNYLLIARALAKETKLDDCYTTTAPTIQLQSLAGYVLRWCYNILAALQESYDCDFAAYLSSFQAVMSGPFNVVHLINSRFDYRSWVTWEPERRAQQVTQRRAG